MKKISGLRRKRMNPKHYRWQKERKDNSNNNHEKIVRVNESFAAL